MKPQALQTQPCGQDSDVMEVTCQWEETSRQAISKAFLENRQMLQGNETGWQSSTSGMAGMGTKELE